MEAPFPNIRTLDLRSAEPGTDDLVSRMNVFLSGFSWAKQTGNVWVARSIPGVFGLFLVELDAVGADVDRYVWVAVGDIPPAYLSSEYAASPREALEGYLAEMGAWVKAVENGHAVDDRIPVDGAPTQENAEALKSRLLFLESNPTVSELTGGLMRHMARTSRNSERKKTKKSNTLSPVSVEVVQALRQDLERAVTDYYDSLPADDAAEQASWG
jgi:hypothetical protein